MNVFAPSVFGRVQKNRSLLFTTPGVLGQTMNFTIPSIPFNGSLVLSVWYKIANDNPQSGDSGKLTLANPPNSLSFGVEYIGNDQGRLFAELNTSRFESEFVFDADLYNEWMHICAYLDWTAPAASKVYWNNVDAGWSTQPAPDSTQFTPATSLVDLSTIVSGVELTQVYMAPADGYIDETNFASAFLPRTTNTKSPYGLGKRGGLAMHRLPWVYLSFQSKRIDDTTLSNGFTNDANGSILTFSSYTGQQINLDADVALPDPTP